MCNHSYHQRCDIFSIIYPFRLLNLPGLPLHRCVAENETECPACVREHAVIREIRQTNEKLADQHDVFLSEVQDSGFEAIASAYGRGVLNTSRLEEAV
jgi:hypothetical protein